MKQTKKIGKLYLVATHIGNKADITERALEILRNTPYLYCEERKPGYRLIRGYGIQSELETLNEHNEKDKLEEIWKKLESGKDVAYFSDAGTPLIADPGFRLLNYIRAKKGTVVPIPGTSSLTVALSMSPFPIDRFMFFGFLSNKKELRKKHLAELKSCPTTAILLETPYRLKKLISELQILQNEGKELCFCSNLTLENEEFLIGSPKKLMPLLEKYPKTTEFIVLVSPPRFQPSYE